MPLRLPRHLETSLWAHVQRELPYECVGVIGAQDGALRALYPLRNIASNPAHRYLADPASLLRALRAMEQDGLKLAAIYHSHPHGRARPSRSDLDLAEYRVPYLIADAERHELRAYLLPQGEEVEVALE